MPQFFSVPVWVVAEQRHAPTHPEALRPGDAATPALVAKALSTVEYRGDEAWARALSLDRGNVGPATYARPPGDLPALLRTADQLLAQRARDLGDRAQLFRCACQTEYALPQVLLRPKALTCERCGARVDLSPEHAVGETRVATAEASALNDARAALADFFREAMARGWPVLVVS